MAPVPADPPSGVDQGTTPLRMEVPGDHDHVAGSSRSAIELESGRLAEAKVRRRGRGTYVRPILPAMAQATRYSVDDLMEYTKGCFDALSARDATVTTLKDASDHFAEWEADWFLRGVEDLELFDVKVHDCRSGFVAAGFEGDLFLSRTGSPRDAHFLHVRGRKGGGARTVGREGVTHMAAVAKLVGEFQYPAGTIRSESARFEVDIEAFDRPAADPEARRVLAAEVKVRESEHEALVVGMRGCGGRGDIDTHREAVRHQLDRHLSEGACRNHHKKCRWLADERPATFWVISRDRSDVFAASYPSKGVFNLTPLTDDALRREVVVQRAAAGS